LRVGWGNYLPEQEYRNLNDLFTISFQGRRDRIALEFAGAVFTFGDIGARSNRLAHLLSKP
jgi:hypothetical protein